MGIDWMEINDSWIQGDLTDQNKSKFKLPQQSFRNWIEKSIDSRNIVFDRKMAFAKER